jgi:fumarate reductase subunit D
MNLGRLLISAGVVLIALGVIVLLVNRLNLPLGRLPGDVVWRGKNSTFYFPWVTCLLLSLLGTLLLWLFSRRP